MVLLRAWTRWPRRRHKRLIKDVFPVNPQSTDMNEAGMERLTVYALQLPKKLPEVGLYLERRVGKKFARKEYGHLQVAIRILHKLILACHVDLGLFADVVDRLTKFLLRQVDKPELQMLGCETFSIFANTLDEAKQVSSLLPFVDDLVRLCLDTQPRPDLRMRIRDAGLRAIMTMVVIIDASLSEQFGKIMPAVLVNMNVAPQAPGGSDPEMGMQSGGETVDIDSRVRDAAGEVFCDMFRALKPAIAPFILKPMFTFLDGNNCWAQVGDASLVRECMDKLMTSMPPQHNYLIFIEMQRRAEVCCREATDPNVRLSTVKAVAAIARNIRGTPGPAYYRLILSILDIFAANVRSFSAAHQRGDLRSEEEGGDEGRKGLSAADKMRLLQEALSERDRDKDKNGAQKGRQNVEVTRQLVAAVTNCLAALALKLTSLPQQADAASELANRCLAVFPPPPSSPAFEVEWVPPQILVCLVGAMAALVNDCLHLSAGKTVPLPILTFLACACGSSSPSCRRSSAETLQAVICGLRPRPVEGTPSEEPLPPGKPAARAWSLKVTRPPMP